MSEAPRVSVIMPVYNCERYVAEAVQSIVNQSFSDFEFLIFDDGSTDSSLDILRSFARADPRLRLASDSHAGYVAWLKRGVDLARGEFLARMDADDIAMRERFAKQVRFLEDHSAHVALGTRTLVVDADGAPIAPANLEVTHEDIDRLHMQGGRGGSRICHPTVLMRADAVRSVGGYRQCYEFAEDIDLFLRLAERGQIANLPDVLLQYRIHPKTVGQTRRARQLRMIREAVAEAHQRRGLAAPEDLHDRLPAAGKPADIHRWIGSTARDHGFVETARKHAWIDFRARPWSRGSWQLMRRAWFGR
jgi:glycosyltransferase involved in cell wall biosynthesis